MSALSSFNSLTDCNAAPSKASLIFSSLTLRPLPPFVFLSPLPPLLLYGADVCEAPRDDFLAAGIPCLWTQIVVRMEMPSDLMQLVQAYSAIILSALLPIYTGSQASVKAPKSGSKPKAKATQATDSDSSDEEEIDAITSGEALFAPLFASLADAEFECSTELIHSAESRLEDCFLLSST